MLPGSPAVSTLFFGGKEKSLNRDCADFADIAESPIQVPQTPSTFHQPALLRLSAMISQYFMAGPCSTRHAAPLSPAFRAREGAPNMSANHDHPATVFACRKFALAPRSQAARSSRLRPPSAQLHIRLNTVVCALVTTLEDCCGNAVFALGNLRSIR
jgi:hypothetical protein